MKSRIFTTLRLLVLASPAEALIDRMAKITDGAYPTASEQWVTHGRIHEAQPPGRRGRFGLSAVWIGPIARSNIHRFS